MSPIPVDKLRILITGGAQGIGAATAQLLAEGGAKVMITDVLDEVGTELADRLGPNAVYRRLDVTNEEDWRSAIMLASSDSATSQAALRRISSG